MKKKPLCIIVGVLIVLILSGVAYMKIWGGEPEIKNFDDVKSDYTILAELALDTYNEISPKEEYVVFDVCYDGTLKYKDSLLPLSDEEQKAVVLANEEFDYLRVCKDAVFFHEDETGYYGLVYSEHPVIALYKEKIPQRGRDYHRLTSRWYEWGVFGL